MSFGSVWKFGADNSEYKKAVREMPSEMDRSAKQIEDRTKQMGSRMSGALRELSGILVGGAMLAGLKNLMDDFDKVAKVATRFGASAEDIQRVSVAADLAGVSIDTVARVLTKMSVAASDASSGSKEMAEAFAKAGINAEAFKRASLEQQLIMVSEAFNRARGDADATNQIIELMGTRAAAQMIPLIDNTAALREEMAGVAVASDDVVRKIEAANDRMTRAANEIKVFFAGVLDQFIQINERIGSILAQEGGLFRLIDGLSKAMRGNFIPLFEVLGTSRTIREMEEVELKANAIAELTREGLLSGSDSEKARLIADRMEQISERAREVKNVATEIETTTDNSLEVEKEKTKELERQTQVLQQQEDRRQQAIKDTQREVELIEAQLSGDTARIAKIKEQEDFEKALERTGSFEAAASFAAARAAERAAAESGSGGTSGGGSGAGFRRMSALERLRASAAELNEAAMSEESRIMARRSPGEQRASELEAAGLFRSAANIRAREARRAEEDAARFESRQAARERQKELQSMSPLDRAKAESSDRKLAREQERMARDQSQTEKEREAAKARAAGVDDKKEASSKTLADVWQQLKELNTKLPQNALS
jgi:hypothetical protein